MTIEWRIELNNWLIGVNWNRCRHEAEGPSYICFHLLCFHFCFEEGV